MEPTLQLAPPVVAVIVVHEPGPWFDEVLDALAEQDYTNLKSLFLIAGDPGDIPAHVRERVPNAFVRAVAGNPGYGAAANEVLQLVEGENGFFCFLHDDVALEPTAIRTLVEELYRSNAGIVGPKLVDWDQPTVLQHVGLGVDRFGEVDPLIEPGEVDQEQHDAVRDVFALPSACLLVRADLFRSIRGFDSVIDFYGDDVDLCWRAHLGGARVVVVPTALARHRKGLVERRPDLAHATLDARHRLRSVATLSGARHLPLLFVQLLFVTVAELLIGVLTGKPRSAFASVRALVGLVPRVPAIIARRGEVRPLRHVPDSEVRGLQARGSARLSSYLRSRDSRPVDPESTTEKRWRQTAGSAPAIAWLAVIALVAIGSRNLISGGIPSIGELLRFPASPRRLIGDFRSGWWGHGLGATAAAPTGVLLIALGSVLTLFHMALWQTVSVLGLFVVGYVGMWRLASIFPTARARITGLVVYAALPLPAQALSAGRWGALACYAAMPWVVHLLRRITGIESLEAGSADTVELIVEVPRRKRMRFIAQLALLSAVVIAFTPAFALVLVGVGVVLGVTTLASQGSWRVSAGMFGAAVTAAVLAVVVNFPWFADLFGDGGWDLVAGVPPVSSRSVGVARLARFALGRNAGSFLTIALFVPVVVAPLVARSWRLTWSIRAAGLVVAFGWLIVLDDRGSLPVRLPEPGVLLAPVAVGLALAAACLAASFADDVMGGSFGLRQPIAVLAAFSVVVGVLPGIYAVGSGRWNMPRVTLVSQLRELPPDSADGDYRVLWIGDPRVMPVEGWTLRPGIAYAITDDGELDVREHWAGLPTEAEQRVADAIGTMTRETTLRLGRLLAPYAIRYIIIPVADGAASTVKRPLPLPGGLTDALDDQLDLRRPLTSPLNYIVYENTAWIPTRSLLTGDAAEATTLAGDEALVEDDLEGAVPVGVGALDRGPAGFDVAAGTVHVAVPDDSHWKLSVDGRTVPSHTAFGSTMAFDVPAGRATLTYDTSASRTLGIVVQLLLWLVLLYVASTLDPVRWWRRRRRLATVSPSPVVLSITEPIIQPVEPEPDAYDEPAPWADEPMTDPLVVVGDDDPLPEPATSDSVDEGGAT